MTSGNGGEILFAGANGVVVWRSLERPLTELGKLQRGEAVTVLERLKDNWVRIQLGSGAQGFVQSSALTPVQWVPPTPVAQAPPAPMTPAPAAPPPTAPSPEPAAQPAMAPVQPSAAPPPAAQPAAPPAAQPTPTVTAPSPPSAPAAATSNFCATCGTALAPNVAFCASCGARVGVGGPTAAAAPMQVAWSAGQVSLGGAATIQRDYLGYVLCNLLLIVSAFLPWEVVDLGLFGEVSGNGFDVNRGWVVFICALIAGGAALWAAFQQAPVALLKGAQFLSAIAGVGMALIEFNVISDYCEGELEACSIEPGIGVFVALLTGAVLLAIAAFRPVTWRSFLLVFFLNVIGIGIEWYLRSQEKQRALGAA
jgi:hypothetical protein